MMQFRYLPYVAPFGVFVNAMAFTVVDHWRRWVYLVIAALFMWYLLEIIRDWRALLRQYR